MLVVNMVCLIVAFASRTWRRIRKTTPVTRRGDRRLLPTTNSKCRGAGVYGKGWPARGGQGGRFFYRTEEVTFFLIYGTYLITDLNGIGVKHPKRIAPPYSISHSSYLAIIFAVGRHTRIRIRML
jgi:hypothetical protein